MRRVTTRPTDCKVHSCAQGKASTPARFRTRRQSNIMARSEIRQSPILGVGIIIMGILRGVLTAGWLLWLGCPLVPGADLAAGADLATGADVESLLETLRAVGPMGQGNREAARAWEELVKTNARELPTLLAGLDDAGPLGANWIRTAVDAIAERELHRGGRLPLDRLEQFVKQTDHDPRARRLAYEWLSRVDRSAEDRLIDEMLDDPSVEFRRDAVARLIQNAERALETDGSSKAAAVYGRALDAARDPDQIKLLAGRLRELKQEVDLARHFGFVVRWNVIGPFDNTQEKGFDTVYPPERQFDVDAAYSGKHAEVKWNGHVTKDEYGKVDLNKILAAQKEVVGYAAAEFVSSGRQEVQFRATSYNAVKVWLNGETIAEHNIYHAGSQLDQYAAPAVLRPGRNLILIKVCQNAQTQDWAEPWWFQLRVCDATGGAILSADRN